MRLSLILSGIVILLILPIKIEANANWYYPMNHYLERQTVKGFGSFIDDNFYKSKENLFPYNRFYGYHAGVDLEVFLNEQNQLVPVYTVSSGTISYIGLLSGYGGVILEKLDNINHTSLYGHVKIRNLSFVVGDHIGAGQILTYLGDAFSDETSKERKHLHFALHKGTDLYFHGHEGSLDVLSSKWENPNDYLKSKGAISPTQSVVPLTSSSNIIQLITNRIEQIFRVGMQILLKTRNLKL